MKARSVICILLLLFAGSLAAQAQYAYGCLYSDGLFYCVDGCYDILGWPVPCPDQEDNIDGVDGQFSDNQAVNGSKYQDNAGQQNLANPKGSILMVLPQKDYQEIEFNEPKAYFFSQGFQVKTASKEVATATSSGGESVAIDVDIKKANLSEYIAIVFVGGIGINDLKLYEDQDYLSLAKNAGSKDMVIGAICLAPKILASAGLLNGKEATSSDPDYIQSKGAKYVNQPVVRSGKIITGNGPDASGEFAKAIAVAISDQNFAMEKRTITEQHGNLVLNLGSSSASTPSDQGAGSAAKWRCTLCGYIYDPAENNGVSFEQLPADWKCPTCGVGKEKFVKVVG